MVLRRAPLAIVVLAAIGCAAEAAQPPAAPPTETVLLGPPDPAAPTQRGVFLRDPKGQVERLTAGGRFVAWSVRTPADKPRSDTDAVVGSLPPATLPRASKLVIADERGGPPLTVDLGRRWVSRLRMVRGAGGPAEPQLAVASCATRKRSSCRAELLTLTAEPPLQVTARVGGAAAGAALAGHLDSGRLLGVASRGPCGARLSVRELGGSTRILPALPTRDRDYPRCHGLLNRLIYGRYAFATVRREAPRHRFDADFVYGLDLAAGPAARWVEVARPYRSTNGGGAVGIGPAVTDRALYWETYDTIEEAVFSLDQVALPRDLEQRRTIDTPSTSDPIAPDAGNVCDIAATDAAIYELANPRCTLAYGTGRSGEIRRVVNPEFRPYEG